MFPPEFYMLKRIVDGSSIGKPRLASIRRVLHNHKGIVLGFFSVFVRIKDSNEAELLVVIKDLELSSCRIILLELLSSF